MSDDEEKENVSITPLTPHHSTPVKKEQSDPEEKVDEEEEIENIAKPVGTTPDHPVEFSPPLTSSTSQHPNLQSIRVRLLNNDRLDHDKIYIFRNLYVQYNK